MNIGSTVGVNTTDEELDNPTLYFVDETEIAGIMEANHTRKSKMLSAKELMAKNMDDIIKKKLKPLVSGKDEPFVLE